MPERITINTEPGGMNLAAERATAASVIRSSVPRMIGDFISLGETHGMEPFAQYAGTDFDGVPPPTQAPRLPNGARIQPAGRFSPSLTFAIVPSGSESESASGLMRSAPGVILRAAAGGGRRTGHGLGRARLGRQNQEPLEDPRGRCRH